MANYRRDILEIEDHFNWAEEFAELLKQETEKAASEKRKEFFEAGYNLIEKQLNRFTEKRNQQFAILCQRGEESADLRKKIVELSGVKDFTIRSLQEFFAKSKLAELDELRQMLEETMTKMLELDQKLMELLKMEIEAVKLELHRMQVGAQSKKVYQNQVFQEAKFIDKMK